MKKFSIIAFATIAILFTSCCNHVQPPDAVLSAFDEMFPAAEKTEWEQEDDDVWEVDFYIQNDEMSAAYEANGKWLETETELDIAALPKAVTKALEMEFPGFEIEEAELIKSPEYSGYEIEIEKKEGDEELEYEIIISAEGIIITKELIDEDDDHHDGHDHDGDHDHGHN